jgi:hypothetical protein
LSKGGEFLEGLAGAARDRGEWIVSHGDMQAGFLLKQVAESWQEGTSADEHQTVVCDVG